MIIDAHVHLGVDRVYDCERDEQEIISAMEENAIDISIVQGMYGQMYLEEMKKQHDRIYKMSKEYSGKIFGMITLNPYLSKQDYYDEAKRCVEEYGFVGIKLHPGAQAINPAGKTAEVVWETCAKLDLPLMVHTGPGVPFALPALCIPKAKQFPEVKVILAHSGLVSFAGEAFLAAQECENIILETSWTARHHIEHMVRSYGANRVMFAADEASNIPAEIAKYNTINISPEEKEQCMSKTAIEVFRLPVKN